MKFLGAQVSKIWRYKLEQPYRRHCRELSGVHFANEWLWLDGHGNLQISKGYAWDGCSPAVKLPLIGWVGTPDGKLGIDGRPQAFFASLVHDVLCQFAPHLPIFSPKLPSDLFYNMLLEAGFSQARAKIYRAAVLKFGPQNWGENIA